MTRSLASTLESSPACDARSSDLTSPWDWFGDSFNDALAEICWLDHQSSNRRRAADIPGTSARPIRNAGDARVLAEMNVCMFVSALQLWVPWVL